MPKQGATLRFDNIHLSIKNSTVLDDVSGKAEPGQLLALLGPSGKYDKLKLDRLSARVQDYFW